MTIKQCVLLQHGLALAKSNTFGICCYNNNDPRSYTSYDVDPIACRACLDQERNGIHSYRQGVNQKYGLVHNHRLPIVLELAPTRNCNLACKICDENSSSSWARLKQTKIYTDYNLSVAKFADKFSQLDLSQVQEINFSGGEPFLNNNLARYLNKLESKIDFENCTLRFVTNGTGKLTGSISNLLAKFKLVQARFSIDDIEQGYEYQRPPAKWSEVESNWKQFLDQMPHNSMASINRTVSVLNINRLHMLDQWYNDNFKQSRFQDPIELIDHFAFGSYKIDTVPRALRELIYNKHGTNSRSWKYIKDRPVNENISKLQETINYHDQLHNTSLQQVDPELYKVLFL
jgi:organic radical activating enzyme